MSDSSMPLSRPGDVILMSIQSAAQRVRRAQRQYAQQLEDGHLPARGVADGAMGMASAAIELETLITVAEAYIGGYPEMAITRERLDAALSSEESPALFGLE